MNHMDDCFAGAPQEFLICITVHKASGTGVARGELYVKVSLDKMIKNTKTHANTENPFFNEYFVFEFHCTLMELLRLSVLFQLKKYLLYKKNVVVGELLIDLHSVWAQPGHNFFKKWGRLDVPLNENVTDVEATDIFGYLQIDLAIISQHSTLRPGMSPEDVCIDYLSKFDPQHDYEDIQTNMLHDVIATERRNIRYFITFYAGIFNKKSNYMIQVSFAGFKANTRQVTNTCTPVWNEEISFAWEYPSLVQHMLIRLFHHDTLHWLSDAEYELNFDEISFNNKPALGPTYIHLYHVVNSTNYIGRILIKLHSNSISDQQTTNMLLTQFVQSPEESLNWVDKNFLAEFVPCFGDHIYTSSLNCTFTTTIAEFTSNPVDCILKYHTSGNTKAFRQKEPFESCKLRVFLPDNRNKYDCDFFMAELIHFMRRQLATFKIFQLKYPNGHDSQARCLKYIISKILNKIGEAKNLNLKENVDDTQWDRNRQEYLSKYFAELPKNLRILRNNLKFSYHTHIESSIVDMVNELYRMIGDITSTSSLIRIQDDWPDLLINMSTGNKTLGVCRVNSKHFMFYENSIGQTVTNYCWKVRPFVFKHPNCQHSCANCGCSSCVVEGCAGIMLESELHAFHAYIASDWIPQLSMWSPIKSRTYFTCKIYVHQAKIRPGADRKLFLEGHLRVFLAGKFAEIPSMQSSLSPFWDSIITFQAIFLPGNLTWYLQNPPLLCLDLGSSEHEFGAVGQTTVSVIAAHYDMRLSMSEQTRGWTSSVMRQLNKLKHLSPPPLKWVPMVKNGMVQGEVLMSAELKELLGSPENGTSSVVIGIPKAIRPTMLNYVLEVIFVGMRNYTKTSLSMAGKRRIKIMLGDVQLCSGLSTTRVRNTINFLMPYAAAVVGLPDQHEYWPAMIATDVLVSSFCNDMTLGAALVPISTSFLQKNNSAKCVRYTASSAASMPLTQELGSISMEGADENDNNKSHKSRWKRLKQWLGWYTMAVANRHGLKSDEYAVTSNMHDEIRFTWWTKFFNALHSCQNDNLHNRKHSLIIYPNELEKQAEFSFLQDWAVPIPLVHGVRFKKTGPPKEDVYSTLKLSIKLTPCQCDAVNGDGAGDSLLPPANLMNPHNQQLINTLTERLTLLVRVYVVRGMNIRPRDWSSGSDCYVRLLVGGKMVSNQAHYIPNQCNPVFGRTFELDTTLPDDNMLEVAIYDHDTRKDDIIGCTLIDLEDRWHSQHRANQGLPLEYSEIGYNKWQDMLTPMQLLIRLCQQRNIHPPIFYENVVEVDGMLFKDETVIAKTEDIKQRLSITVLNNLKRLHSFGYKLVPEHVETRSLYHEDFPGVEQGKLQMWVELFDRHSMIPAPIDITPIPPIQYEVRVVVKNLSDIPLNDENIFGKLMSDIYVVGWCHDMKANQKTDIHYRSFAGEASFNWRMIFSMKYSPQEDMMVIRQKSGLREETEIKEPPIIYMQIWDNDLITRDDYLCYIELNLSNLPLPYATKAECHPFPSTRLRFNLFTRKSIKGWFPLQGPAKGQKKLISKTGGKIQLQLDVCTEVEANNSPAGRGHDPPMALEKPNRPQTSFNPLWHPFKSLHLIFWSAIRKYVLIALLFLLIGSGFILFFANLPLSILSIPLE